MRMPTIKSLKSESSLGWDDQISSETTRESLDLCLEGSVAEMVQVLGPGVSLRTEWLHVTA